MTAGWPAQARDLFLRILVVMAVLSGAAYFLQDSLLHHP